jgi:hypothetical protein
MANSTSQCDQATPCGQCVRAGSVCPGYRDTVDVLFRDESAKVARKSKGQSSKPTAASTASEDEVATQNVALVKLFKIGAYQPWDDVGINFFMSNYVGTDPDVSSLHYLPNFYLRSGHATSSLKRTIIASGLAGYARTFRRTDLVEQSARTYAAAVRDINNTLSNPQAVIQDTTLMSIIVAAIFETILVSQDSSIDNITKHMEGAMAVAYLSLQQREPSTVYKALLSNLIQGVIMNCWIQHVPLPSKYKQTRLYLPEKINPRSVHAKLVNVLSQVIEFRDDLKKGLYSSSDMILHRALELDGSLKTFIEEMPTHTLYEKFWISRIHAMEVQQHVYNKTFHSEFLRIETYKRPLIIASLPSAVCWPSLELCTILPNSYPPAGPPPVLYADFFKHWKQARKSTPTKISL